MSNLKKVKAHLKKKNNLNKVNNYIKTKSKAKLIQKLDAEGSFISLTYNNRQSYL